MPIIRQDADTQGLRRVPAEGEGDSGGRVGSECNDASHMHTKKITRLTNDGKLVECSACAVSSMSNGE